MCKKSEIPKYIDYKNIDTHWKEEEDYIVSFGVKHCKCEVSSGSSFIDDSDIMKHHYVCNDCGYVTQIG